MTTAKTHSLSFWNWLREQRFREDPVGDLARDAIEDYDKGGHKEIRSIGGLRARIEAIEAGQAMDALNDALREWRETKRPLRADVEAVLNLLDLVAQDRSYRDGSVRVARAEQFDHANPHPRAYLPQGCSLSEAVRLISEAGFTKDRSSPVRGRGSRE